MRESESPKSTTWPDTFTVQQRIDALSLATIAEMRKIPFLPFPDDTHIKAVEFAMIVRNEFTKRLKLELAVLANADPVYIRVRFRKTLATLREEITQMADNGSGWLEEQLEHSLKDNDVKHSVVRDWADSYLDALLMSIGV